MRSAPQTRHLANFGFALLIAGAGSAFASPVFQVVGQGGEGPFNQSSSSFLSRASSLEGSIKDPNTGYSSGSANNAYAAAGPGGLHVDANSWILNDSPVGANGHVDTAAAAFMTLDDLIISGPSGAMISTSFRVHVSGTLEASTSLQAMTSGASATLSVRLEGNGKFLNDGLAVVRNGQGQTAIGLLQNFTGSNDLTSDPFTITANQAFAIAIQLSVGAFSALASNETGISMAAAHFGNSLTFVTDGPVFNLPEGYTANSVSGNIVDNHFAASTVPLPPAIWLLGTALGGLGLRRSRRRLPA